MCEQLIQSHTTSDMVALKAHLSSNGRFFLMKTSISAPSAESLFLFSSTMLDTAECSLTFYPRAGGTEVFCDWQQDPLSDVCWFPSTGIGFLRWQLFSQTQVHAAGQQGLSCLLHQDTTTPHHVSFADITSSIWTCTSIQQTLWLVLYFSHVIASKVYRCYVLSGDQITLW